MWKRIVLWLGCVMLMTGALYAAQVLCRQRLLAEKTVRLHVVANSDTADDQAQKLRVRDAVLKEVTALTADCTDARQVQDTLRQHLAALRSTAQQTLHAEGSDYEVEVTLGEEMFDTRYYESFTLPAGKYPALRVQIGAAQGQNWWCVVFPSLCTAATSDALTRSAEVGGYNEDEIAWITDRDTQYVFRFKTLEWLKALSELFR